MTAAAATPEHGDLVAAKLVAETAAVKPSDTIMVAVQLKMKKGWHTYWRNPGDSGQATEIEWTLPEGWRAGAIRWPVPDKFLSGIATSYGYGDEASLLVPITVSADAPRGARAKIDARVSWLVCAEICIPQEAKLSVTLPVAAKAPANVAAIEIFARARSRLPRDLPSPTSARLAEDAIAIDLPAVTLEGMAAPQATFMPFLDTLIDHGAPQKLSGKTLGIPRGQVAQKPPQRFDGLLVVEENGTRRAFNLSVELQSK